MIIIIVYLLKGALADTSNIFGRGTSRIVARNFGCNGAEIRLSNCPHNTLSFSSYIRYQSYRAAGVICQGNTSVPTECEHGDVQLMSGLTAKEGRVEVCAYGYWASVCDGDIITTQLLCKHLGLPTEGCM